MRISRFKSVYLNGVFQINEEFNEHFTNYDTQAEIITFWYDHTGNKAQKYTICDSILCIMHVRVFLLCWLARSLSARLDPERRKNVVSTEDAFELYEIADNRSQ